MRRLMLLILIAGLLALPALGADQPQPPKQFVLEFYDLQLSHLLDLLAKATGISFAVVPPELAQKAITINAGGEPVDLQGALEALRAAGIDHMRVGDTYVFYARSETAAATPGPVVTPPPTGDLPDITAEFRDTALDEALRIIFRGTPYSFAIGPHAKELPRVTLSLQDVPFPTALQVVAQAANADIIREPATSTVYRVVPRPTVTMGGAQIPVVGAVAIGAGGGAGGMAAGAGDEGGGAGGGGFAGGGGGGGGGFVWPSGAQGFTWPTSTPPLPGSGGPAWTLPQLEAQLPPTALPVAAPGQKLVDLDVKDMPIRDAMARLAKASGLQITVHPAVPKTIKVTARAFGVPAEWLLDQIVDQAHLAVMKEAVKGKPATAKAYRYHIVPPPQIKVSGAPSVSPPFKEQVLPRWAEPGPQRMPIAGGVFLLQNDPATPVVPLR